MTYAIRSVVLFCFAIVPNIACAQETRPSSTQPTARDREPTTREWKDLAAELEAFRKNPPKTAEEADRAKDLHAKLVAMAISSAKGDFHIKGEVTDESGQRMKGVKMTITRSAAPDLGGRQPVDGRSEREEKVIDGTFDVTARGWWAVGISFTKDGYYPEELSLMSNANTESVKRLLERGTVEPSTVIKDGLKVQMVQRPVPSPTIVQGKRNFAVQTVGLGGYVIFAKPPDFDDSGDKRDKLLSSGALKDLQADGSLPKDAFTIEVAAKDGHFLLSPNADGHFPQRIVLRLNAPGGGILLHEPLRNSFLTMREAPLAGYAIEFSIDLDSPYMRRLITNMQSTNGAYFYFKNSDGKYGKGAIRGTLFNKEATTADFSIRIYLQTDGSRNVQTNN